MWYSGSRLLCIHIYPPCYYPVLLDVIRPHLLLLASLFSCSSITHSHYSHYRYYPVIISLLYRCYRNRYLNYYLCCFLIIFPFSRPSHSLLLFSHYPHYFADTPISVIVHVVVTHPVAWKPGKPVGFLLISMRLRSTVIQLLLHRLFWDQILDIVRLLSII